MDTHFCKRCGKVKSMISTIPQFNPFAIDARPQLPITTHVSISSEYFELCACPPEHIEQIAKLEQENKALREVLDAIFASYMVCDVRKCRNCPSPVIHMAHLTLEQAKEIEDKAYKVLGRLKVDPDDFPLQ